MSRVNSRIASNLVASIISYSVNLAVSFLLTPYLVKWVGKEAYGFVGLGRNFVNYAAIITAALNSAAGRFITVSMHQGRDDEVSGYVSSVFIANVIMAVPLGFVFGTIVVCMGCFLDIPDGILTDVRWLWVLLFLNFLITLVGNVFSVAAYTQNRLDINSKRNIVSSLIKAAVLVLLFTCFRPAVWYMGFTTLLCGLFVVGTNIAFSKRFMPGLRIQRSLCDRDKIKRLISVGIWNSISRLCSVLLEELDLLITDLFVNASAMGTVSIAKNLPTQMLAFFTLFGGAYGPQLTIYYAKNDFESIKQKLCSSIRVLSMCAVIPMACMYVFSYDFFMLWVPGENARQLTVLTILSSLEFPLVVPLQTMWVAFPVANRTREPALLAIITALTSCALTFILLQVFDDVFMRQCIIVGVSSCLGLLRGGLFLPLFGAHCFGLRWHTFYVDIAKSLLALAFSTGISLAVRLIIMPDTWISLAASCVITLVCSMPCLYVLLLTKQDRASVGEKLRSKLKPGAK